MIGFVEKPREHPKTIPGDPTRCLASMGNYLFTTRELVQEIVDDAGDAKSAHDFGKSIVTGMHKRKPVFVYNFMDNQVPGQTARERGYWRDVGSLDAYYQANMDLVAVDPIFSLYNDHWPIYTHHANAPPAKFVFNNAKEHRVGRATDSLISEGCIVSGSLVHHSILSPSVRVHRDPPPQRHRLRRRGRPEAVPRHRERHRGDRQGDPRGAGLGTSPHPCASGSSTRSTSPARCPGPGRCGAAAARAPGAARSPPSPGGCRRGRRWSRAGTPSAPPRSG
jgi:Nucleotidyl transferase